MQELRSELSVGQRELNKSEMRDAREDRMSVLLGIVFRIARLKRKVV